MKAEETKKMKQSARDTSSKETVSGKGPGVAASKISETAKNIVSPKTAARAEKQEKKVAAKQSAVAERDTARQKMGKTGKSEKPSKATLKIFLPGPDVPEKEPHDFDFSGLPDEYGETSIIAMAVDPNTVFVDWEIIPRDIAGEEGDLTLRLYDITGAEVMVSDVNAVIDVRLNKRVGRDFFDIGMPGRDMIAEEGIMTPEGVFLPIIRSDIISFPARLAYDDLGIVQKLLESGIPVGY